MHTLNPIYLLASQVLKRKKTIGLTLIEVMVLVAVLGVLASLAMPSFRPLIEKWRVQQAVERMKSTLYYARSEAIKRGGHIGIQKNESQTDGCINNQEWNCGWFVFEDNNGNGSWQKTTEAKLQTISAPTNVNVMHTSGAASFKVDQWGMMNGLNAKGFTFTPEPGKLSSPATRTICVSSGGRIQVIAGVKCQ